MTIPTASEIAKNAERVRDLKAEVRGLSTEELSGVQFMSLSEGREPVTIYATEDGRPVTIPAYMVPQVMDRRREDGEYRFVADKAKAPEYVLGTIKCFLHADAPERTVVDKAGLAGKFCRGNHISSDYSKTLHAEHKHRQEWRTYQQYLKNVDAAEERDERRQQLSATLRIAEAAQQGANQQAANNNYDCKETGCGWTPKPDAVSPQTAAGMHRKAEHEVEG